jgi:hypothetical protein
VEFRSLILKTLINVMARAEPNYSLFLMAADEDCAYTFAQYFSIHKIF